MLHALPPRGNAEMGGRGAREGRGRLPPVIDPARDRASLLAWIAGDGDLAFLLGEARRRLSRDPGHDEHHALRVALAALRIGRAEGVPDRHAVAAALLHDIVPVAKDSPDRPRASALCAEEAARILRGLGWPEEAVADVADAVRDHSFSRGAVPAAPLGRALQDADRLDALGALGVLRTVSTGARMGADYFDPEDPWARRRELDDRRHSVDHFYRKLLRLPGTMTTEAGRREALRRAARMEEFLRWLGDEIGEPPPG